MSKTVFWRNRVLGGNGVRLEPCRANNLNMWFECEFNSTHAGIELVGGSGDWGGAFWAVSTRFTNVGRPVMSGTDLPMVNCLVEIGSQSHWALPSGGRTLLEGCNSTLLPGANSSATLFQPQAKGAGSRMILINNQLADMPLGSADGPTHATASWILANNRFARPAQAGWNRLLVRLQGTNEKVVAHVLARNMSEATPVSGLLFSGGGW